MTAKELRDYLENLPDEMEVILSNDQEGNGYRAAYAIDIAFDDEENGYPSIENADEYYETQDDEPKERVVVIV